MVGRPIAPDETPNVKLSGRQQRAVLDSERKMGRKALRSMAGAARCWRSA